MTAEATPVRWHGRDLVFALVVIGVVILRFRILRAAGAPPTIDTGNWLAFGDSILGRAARSPTIVYPPLVPLASTASVGLFGLVNGTSLLAAVSSAMPAVGVYWTMRRLGLALGAVFPALLVLGAAAVGEAAAWGGFPQLVGLGLLPVALYWIDRAVTTWSAADGVRAGLGLALIMATSHLIASLAITASGLVVMLTVLNRGTRSPAAGEAIRTAGLLIAPGVWLWPLYATLAGEVFRTENSFRHLTELTWGSLVERIEFVFRDLPIVWWPLLAGAVAAVWLLRRHQGPLWRMTTGLLLAVATLTAFTREGRYLYAVMTLTALGLGLWITFIAQRTRSDLDRSLDSLGRSTAIAVSLVTILVAGQMASGLDLFGGQRDFYGVLDADLVDTATVVAEQYPTATIGVPSLRDAPLGWWIEAITDQPVIYGAPLRWLVFEDEIRRASLANAIFAPPFPTSEKLTQAASVGMNVIILPTDWVFYDAAAIEDLAALDPGVVAEDANLGVTLLFPAAP